MISIGGKAFTRGKTEVRKEVRRVDSVTLHKESIKKTNKSNNGSSDFSEEIADNKN